MQAMGLFIEYLRENPTFYFSVIVTVIISVTLHELAHGWTAIWYGDNTPAEMDRLTPNPLVHMGIMSLIFVAIAGLGWGAMPVNPSRMRGRYAHAVVSLAGPAMNLLIALGAILIWGIWSRLDTASAFDPNSFARTVFYFLNIVAIWNIALAAFNLIPIPPLDGSKVLADFVPAFREWAFQPTMIGVWNALFIGLFFFAGRILWPFAANTTEMLVSAIRGY